MSKKKILATALLSASLLGAATVVSAEETVVKQVTPTLVPGVPNKVYTVNDPEGTTTTETTYYITPTFNLVNDTKTVDGKVVSDGFHYEVSFTLNQSVVKTTSGKASEPVVSAVPNTAVFVTIAGQKATATTDANGAVTISLPKNFVVNDQTPVNVEFTLNSAAGQTESVTIKTVALSSSVSYADGVITVKQPNKIGNGTYVIVTTPDGAVSSYTIESVDNTGEVKFNVGSLATATTIKVYENKAAYDGYIANYAAATDKSTVTDPAVLKHTVAASTPMYRVYNPNNGEHLYTTNSTEYTTLVSLGWTDEGVAWQAATAGKPVYRVYNPNNGDHHYTLDADEVKNLVKWGWVNEGTVFYSEENTPNVAIFRLYNPNATGAGSHHYTTDAKEANALVGLGWTLESQDAWNAAAK